MSRIRFGIRYPKEAATRMFDEDGASNGAGG